MIRDVTLCNVSCHLSRNLSGGHGLFYTASFYWLLNRNIARQVAIRGMLMHCAMAGKCIEAYCGKRCEKQNLILLRAMLLATKMLPGFMIERHVTLSNFARQVARAQVAYLIYTAKNEQPVLA